MKYDWILIALYLLVLVVIAKELFSMAALTVVIVLLMVIVIIQKMGLERLINSGETERNKKLDDMTSKIEEVSRKVDNHKEDFSRQVVFVDSKVNDVRHFVEVEINNAYSDLSRRLVGIEDKLNEMRHIFSAAVGSLDERIQSTEQKDEDVF
jgi:low affinity Fe/Cu permease